MSDEAAAEPIASARLGRRNDRLLLVAVVAYVVLLSGLMIARGVSVTPDVLLVALGMAAVLLGRGRLFFRDWIPFIGLFFAYELMRGYADNAGLPIHAADVIVAERVLFLGHVPTEVLQSWLHPASGFDPWAMVSVVFYFLHFPLPIAVGFVLWLWRRPVYYDYVAALIVLAMAGFVTYLLLPVAPPWWAHEHGLLDGIAKLRDQGFSELASAAGFDQAKYVYSYTFYDINPNEVAAFPSLHTAFPFLGFLFARRTFGRIGWLMLVYTASIVFAIVYLGEHYVVDAIAGIAYAYVAYRLVLGGPAWIRRLVDRAEDVRLDAQPEPGEAGVAAPGPAEAGAPGSLGGLRGLRGAIRWDLLGQGIVLAVVGVVGIVAVAKAGLLGGTGSPIYLVPWAVVLLGLWRGALGLMPR